MNELAIQDPKYIEIMKSKHFGYGWYDDISIGSLYFYYGTMGAGKSALAIQKAKEFKIKGIDTYIYVPKSINVDKISSRNGESLQVSNIDFNRIPIGARLIIDEAQFLSAEEIEEIRTIMYLKDVTVFCFGLLTTFKKDVFDGSRLLLDVATSIREIPMKCEDCRMNNAVYNFKKSSNNALVDLDKSKYVAVCPRCFIRNQWRRLVEAEFWGKDT